MSPSPRQPWSSILFETADRSVVVVDLPRSIEEAQELQQGDRIPTGRRRRLVSAPAPTEPFAGPHGSGPAGDQHANPSLAAQLAELTTKAAVEGALGALGAAGFDGPWCLPRRVRGDPVQGGGSGGDGGDGGGQEPFIPPQARCLEGTIAACRDTFAAEAPQFDLVVLDPPWPNRSARRRRQGRKRKSRAGDDVDGADSPAGSHRGNGGQDSGYDTARDMQALREMLELIPVGAKLAGDGDSDGGGLVAVWVTNKAACEALLTDPKRGVFRAWGVEPVAAWTWLKVTASGAPVVPVDALWRRPWERLLLARRPRPRGGAAPDTALPAHRVVVGVPDVHSRKPHLLPLLAPFVAPSTCRRAGNGRLCGLEVFARNLTAGWWAWGNEALLFQHPSWWTADAESEEEVHGRRAAA